MPRPPLAVGTYGKIDFLTIKRGHVRARARYRDYDGVVRATTRCGSTKPRAESTLKEALRDRVNPTADQIGQDSRLAELADLWVDEINGRALAVATKELYSDVVGRIVKPGLGALRVRELTVPITDRFIKTTAARSGARLGGDFANRPVRHAGSRRTPRLARFEPDPGRRAHLAATKAGALAGERQEHSLVVQDRPKSDAGWRVIALPTWIIELRKLRADRSVRRDVVFPPRSDTSAIGRTRPATCVELSTEPDSSGSARTRSERPWPPVSTMPG
jgi:hypothetical protein